MRADVLCIGAGPASLAAAIGCARAGLKVVIVTPPVSAAPPRPSETVHPGIESLLRPLGAIEVLAAASRGRYRGIWRDDTYTALGADHAGPWIGHHIDRGAFDAALLAHAIRSGAKLRPGRVDSILADADGVRGVTSSAGTLDARYTIDGSGRSALAARRLGKRECVASAPLIAWSGLIEDATCEEADPRFVMHDDGWEWRAPESDGRITWTRLVVAGSPRLVRPMPSSGRIVAKLIGKSVRWRTFDSVVTDGLVMVGDAAGMLDPGAGQGVFRALLTGIHGSHAVLSAMHAPISAPLALARYDAWFAGEYHLQRARLRRNYDPTTAGFNARSLEGAGYRQQGSSQLAD